MALRLRWESGKSVDGVFRGRPQSFRYQTEQWTTAAWDEGEWRKTAEQRAGHFIATLIASDKYRDGPRCAVVCSIVTGRTKDRIAQSKNVFGLVCSKSLFSHRWREFANAMLSLQGATFAFFEDTILRSIILRYLCDGGIEVVHLCVIVSFLPLCSIRCWSVCVRMRQPQQQQ